MTADGGGQGGLFDAADIGPDRAPLSRGARLTARKNAAVACGVHPVSGLALLPAEQGKRCENCAHLFAHRRNQTWWKCSLNATRGAATDVRLSYPACTGYAEAGTP